MTGGNTLNLVLQRMLKYFLKFPPLQKTLQFQGRICLTTTIQQVTGGETLNLVLNRMLKMLLKIPPLKNRKKTAKLIQKKTSNQKLNQ